MKLLALAPALFLACLGLAADLKFERGLLVTFLSADGKITDTGVTPNVCLFVGSTESPTPFLPAGQFTAVWEGLVSADLRGDYMFQAEINGSLKLELNGRIALQAAGDAITSPLSQPVTLNKGRNKLKATFISPTRGDAFVRLAWTDKGTQTSPMPLAILSHATTSELQKSAELRLGRELFLELRCARCHAGKPLAGSVPEFSMDAPSFEGIGARRNYDWMARWILDPKSLRPDAHMPRLVAGPTAKENANAMAAFLATLRTGGEVKLAETVYQTKQNLPGDGDEAGPPAENKPLYEKLHCIGCHNPPDAKDPDPRKLSQNRIAEKFPPGRLAEFLRAPEAHYAWTRMPNFHLSAKEAKELEDWLLAAAPKSLIVTPPTEAAMIEKGRKLVQTTGCLNCHALKLENQFANQPFDILFNRHVKERSKIPVGDCLGHSPIADYQFGPNEKAALNAFTATGPGSLVRHVFAEFAERQARSLQCASCHGQLESVPPLEVLGGKLRPEWAGQFIGGKILHKVRYDLHPKGGLWLESRMPAFKSRAGWLAAGLAAQHGYSAKSTVEPPVNVVLARMGQMLVGKEGGFSCVACHGIGSELAREVFESEGINLAYSAERLLPDYYRRWMRNPASIDPQTKMPVYFDEGKSPLTEVLDGDAEKQISAVWEYLRLGDKMTLLNAGDSP